MKIGIQKHKKELQKIVSTVRNSIVLIQRCG